MKRARAAAGVGLLAAAAVLFAACGQQISLGDGRGLGGGGQGGGTTTPPTICDDVPCGAPCPNGWCDGAGKCSDVYVCPPYQPCLGLLCGEPCNPCAPSPGVDCPPLEEPFVCDMFGQCLPGPVDCPCKNGELGCPFNPCEGAPCGVECFCDPQVDPACDPSAQLHVCNGYGTCLGSTDVYCDPCVDYVGGVLQACGTPCSPCQQPWDQYCADAYSSYLSVCDWNGVCNPPEVTQCPLEYLPCDGKQCGDPCSVCDPMSPNCFADLPLFCNAAGPSGTCSEYVFDCPQVDCTGQACGTQCYFCQPPGSCQPQFCDASEQCVTADQIACPGYEPCASKACGELCTLCDPLDPLCPPSSTFLVCNPAYPSQFASGACMESTYGLCGDYQPCAGLTCGWPCTLCDPADPNCVEPDPQLKTCSAQGACGPPEACP